MKHPEHQREEGAADAVPFSAALILSSYVRLGTIASRALLAGPESCSVHYDSTLGAR